MPTGLGYFLMTPNSWPGNVRELKNTLEYAFVIAEEGLIGIDQLPASLTATAWELQGAGQEGGADQALDEKSTLVEALRKAQGNHSEAARLLGVSRVTVRHRMKKYGIDLKKVTGAAPVRAKSMNCNALKRRDAWTTRT